MDGVIIIDKPAGITSHDVVDRVRRIFGVRRVGHGGTLDPAATGVLVVLVGLATRLAEYLLEGGKAYRFRVRFGIETGTYDLDGPVVLEEDASGVTREAVEAVMGQFLGEREMLPPMASAVRQDGQRLYAWARRGLELDRAPRSVRIDELRLLDFTPRPGQPEAHFLVRCSKGTYVRSLAMEMGRALGTVGTVVELRRVASSGFTLDGAAPLDLLEEAARTGTATSYLRPMDEAVRSLPRVTLSREGERLFCRGSPCPLQEEVGSGEWGVGSRECRVYGPKGFLGVGLVVPGAFSPPRRHSPGYGASATGGRSPGGPRVVPKKVLWSSQHAARGCERRARSREQEGTE